MKVKGREGKRGRKENFPISNFPAKVHKILSIPEFTHIISWMPHGRSWKVLKPKLFKEIVMPKYFPHQSKYSSFTRQVNGWNFRRITRGPDRFTYYHMFFVKAFPQEAMKMTRGLSDDTCESPLYNQNELDILQMNRLPHNSIGCGSKISIESPYPLSPHSHGINNVMPYHHPDMQLPYYHSPHSYSYQAQRHSPVLQQLTPHHFRQLNKAREVQYSVNSGQHNTSTSDNEWQGKHPRQPSYHDDQYHASTLDYELRSNRIHGKTSDLNMESPRPINDIKEEDGCSQHYAEYSTNGQYRTIRPNNKWRSKHHIQKLNNNQLHKVTPEYKGVSSRQSSKDKQKPPPLSSISHNELELSLRSFSHDSYHKPECLTSSRNNYRRQKSMSLFNRPDQNIWKPMKNNKNHQLEHLRCLKADKFNPNVFQNNLPDQLLIDSSYPTYVSIDNHSKKNSIQSSSLNDESDRCIEWNHSLLSTNELG